MSEKEMRRQEFPADERHAMETRSSRDYVIGAAKLTDPETGAAAVGLVLKSKATGKSMALCFESDPEMCDAMLLLMQAAKEVWPRGWEAQAEKKRVPSAGQPKSLRGLNTEATVPGDTFTEVSGDGDAWRVALVSVPSEAPPSLMVMTLNMPKAEMKPVALTFKNPLAVASLVANLNDAAERLWPSKAAPPPTPGRRGSSFRPRERRRGR